MTENGYGKRTRVSEYPRKGRGGLGVKTVQLTEAKGKLAGARVVARRLPGDADLDRRHGDPDAGRRTIKRLGRATQGVIVMRLRDDEHVSALAPVVESDARTRDRARERSRGRIERSRAGVVEADDPPPSDPDRAESIRSRKFRAGSPSQTRRSACISPSRGRHPADRGIDMAYSTTGRPSRTDQPPEHLDKVELYLGQVCQIAGISKMQLDYWTNKAQIPTKGKKQRIYDIDALETVMLIKQAKDKGLNLGAAIEAARRFRARRTAQLARLARRLALRSRSSARMKAVSMSIGAGKTIVVAFVAPISSSVCR